MEKLKKAISIIFFIILLVILFVSSVILVNSYVYPDKIPSFLGWKPFIVLSGSMETQIMTGDLIIVKDVDANTLKENDIIAFKEDNMVITHRILKIKEVNGEKRYITKGDNNSEEDAGYVLEEQIEGLYQFRIAKLGNLAMFIQTPIGMVICLSIPLIILILMQTVDSRKEKILIKEKEDKQKNMEEEIEKLKKQNEELTKSK